MVKVCILRVFFFFFFASGYHREGGKFFFLVFLLYGENLGRGSLEGGLEKKAWIWEPNMTDVKGREAGGVGYSFKKKRKKGRLFF